MGVTIRADAALLAEVHAGDGATLHTARGAVVSWAALHLLAEHGFRWAPDDPSAGERGPTGVRLHIDVTIDHDPGAGVVLGAIPARFAEAALGAEISFALAEGMPALDPRRLTSMAERRSPQDATFVVTGTGGTAVGGTLTVQRGPRTVFETLRCMVAVPSATHDARMLRDGLEAGLQAVTDRHHVRSAQFSTSRGRVDGVVDTDIAGPPSPLGVFSGSRAVRERGLLGLARPFGGRLIGPRRAPGVVFWFEGSEQDRWRRAAALGHALRQTRAGDVHSEDLRRDDGTRDHGTATGGER
ncbi:hypothetical protein SAMN02800687_1289 [Curtobacterium sp. UNCCL20]|uniref:DUF6177 family protein n=1 Tax=Curtobacterium sp. UNCCL20 TaxID=1502773 RepID=UPI000890CC76|nr:DUF6177 family protein [Curtobacterium sp. UNCCL20]SDQ29954.1 hypothetical protein SAMN02800687_1289 [Curtobacterium sp. UNCCL20]